MDIRRIIIDESRRRGLSGYALAKLAGLSIRTAQAYLSGTCDLAGRRLGAILDALGIELRLKPTRRARSPKRSAKGG